MARPTPLLLCAFFLITNCVVRAEDVKPVTPTNPVEISIEAGSVAGRSTSKIAVILNVVITRKGVTYTTTLEKNASMDYTKFQLDAAATTQLIASLTEATANPDADYAKDLGTLHIENKEQDSKRIVTISEKREGILFDKREIEVDSDNAAMLANLLKKSQGLQAWMKDKVNVFVLK